MPFDEAQAGLVNSGGFVGAVLGFLLDANLAASGFSDISVLSGAWVASTSVGLLAGGGLGRVLDMTWGEVLLCDLSGVLGLLLGGAASIAPAGSLQNVFVATAIPAVGLVGGYGAGIAIVTQWRSSRGAPILRGPPKAAALAPATSFAVIDGRAVPTFGLAGSF
jgi:hypothetical protein